MPPRQDTPLYYTTLYYMILVWKKNKKLSVVSSSRINIWRRKLDITLRIQPGYENFITILEGSRAHVDITCVTSKSCSTAVTHRPYPCTVCRTVNNSTAKNSLPDQQRKTVPVCLLYGWTLHTNKSNRHFYCRSKLEHWKNRGHRSLLSGVQY